MALPSNITYMIIFFFFLLSPPFTLAQVEYPEFTIDPYLQFRPPFPRSLPVQILLTGIVFTLVSVLFIHLILTAQYHWPLAPVNYILQLSGVCTLLISLIATLHVILSAAFSESKKWPYMLSYIAVNVPPLDLDASIQGWSTTERVTWLIMNASTSGLVQITHIHFLTLLYPSRLEKRLIFALLGPLAILAAIMQLLAISDNLAVNTISWAVRNICNATLSLLFTAALFIWGFLVNIKQAWRTDGGTAVFGSAALTLAVVSTGLSLLYVPREEEYVWLPGLMWAVVLWQSFFGWWWWCGAGSGGGNLEDEVLKRAEREARRRNIKNRKKDIKTEANNASESAAEAPLQGVLFPTDKSNSVNNLTFRRYSPTSSDSPRPSYDRFIPLVAFRWYISICDAHRVAAREQAVERVEKIWKVRSVSQSGRKDGWGLGNWGRKSRGKLSRVQEYSKHAYPRREENEIPPNEILTHNDLVVANPRAPHSHQSSSVLWWANLWRWRLRDSTIY